MDSLQSSPLVVISKFAICPEDPRATETRRKMRAAGNPRDLASGTMRLALHLSDVEADLLERLNPETLGRHDDERLREKYWLEFALSPESAPFRVHGGL